MTAAIAPGSVEGVGHVGAVAGHFRTGATDLVDQEGDGRLFVSRGGLMSIIPRGRLLLFVPSERHNYPRESSTWCLCRSPKI